MLLTVDYSDLSGIAMNLYKTGIDAVSPKAMMESALKFSKDENILEVCYI